MYIKNKKKKRNYIINIIKKKTCGNGLSYKQLIIIKRR